MVIPKSQLAAFVADVIAATQAARAHVQEAHLIQTDPFEISFSVDVIDDTKPAIEGDATEQRTPETTQVTTRGPQTQTQTQTKPEVVSKETQTTTPGRETSTQNFGRQTVTEVEYIN